MGGARVLVTRPQPGADKTAARLADLGYDPLVLPLTKTAPLAQRLPAVAPDLVVATSPQAFRHLSAELRDALADIPLILTGEGAASAAREAGFLRVETAGGNAAGLMGKLQVLVQPGSRVLYLAGRVRRPDLERFVAASAADLNLIETYDTLSVSYSTDKLREIAVDGHVSCVLLTSVETVGALAGIQIADFNQAIENSAFICLSSRIAEAARGHFKNRVVVAGQPTEDALMQSLTNAFPRS